MADLQQEHHREIEGLLENIRQLSRELRLQMLIIDNFIPQEYQVCARAGAAHIRSSTIPPDSSFRLSLFVTVRAFVAPKKCMQTCMSENEHAIIRTQLFAAQALWTEVETDLMI